MQATTICAHHDGLGVWIPGSRLSAPRNDVGRERPLPCQLSPLPYLKHAERSPAANELPGIGRSAVSLGLAFVSRFE